MWKKTKNSETIENVVNSKNKRTKGKEKIKKEKNRKDLGRIAIKVTAAVLAIIMMVAVAGTLLYYLTIG